MQVTERRLMEMDVKMLAQRRQHKKYEKPDLLWRSGFLY